MAFRTAIRMRENTVRVRKIVRGRLRPLRVVGLILPGQLLGNHRKRRHGDSRKRAARLTGVGIARLRPRGKLHRAELSPLHHWSGFRIVTKGILERSRAVELRGQGHSRDHQS